MTEPPTHVPLTLIMQQTAHCLALIAFSFISKSNKEVDTCIECQYVQLLTRQAW